MPRDGSATRERILDAAEHLVIENGFAGTSVDQVLATAGTSKGAFFHHFDSKLHLGRELVARYAAADIANLHAALEATSGVEDPAKRLIAFVRYFEDSADEVMSGQSGCLFIAVLTEQQLAGAKTAAPILAAVESWRDAVDALLRDALGDRLGPGDRAALADHMFVTFEGAFMLCRSVGDPGQMRVQLRSYRLLLEALLGR